MIDIKIILYIFFYWGLQIIAITITFFSVQHSTVDLESTGNSQLTIFSDSIISLEVGDEFLILKGNNNV